MKKVRFECKYSIISNDRKKADYDATFSKVVGSLNIDLKINRGREEAIVTIDGAEIEDRHLDELNSSGGILGEKLSDECDKAIGHAISEAKAFTRQILSLMKYHLSDYDIDENMFSVCYERVGEVGGEMHDKPFRLSVSYRTTTTMPLIEETERLIKESVDNGVEPLFAMRHIHRAKMEKNPRYKWIDATIAAELAVKEVISIANKEAGLLLIEMPSPPLSKLYGKILLAVMGEESPYRKKIIKGVEKRNELVHKYSTKEIDHKDADEYVLHVEAAIFHLLTLIYPKDKIIKNRYRSISQAAKCIKPRKLLADAAS